MQELPILPLNLSALGQHETNNPVKSEGFGSRAPIQSSQLISVVIPIFNEAAILPELLRRLTLVLTSITDNFEIVFVNDGSSDETPELLETFVANSERIVAVHLSRNFGHQQAITAGLDSSCGDIVCIIDGDLQDPPELIPDLVDKIRSGYDIVYTVRIKRDETMLRRIVYHLFYRVLRMLSSVHIPLDSGDFCAMTRQAVNNLASLPERHRFLRGLRSWIGLRQTFIQYERPRRETDTSKYTIRKLINLALDGLLSFSSRPLRLIALIGAIISIGSILMAGFYIFLKVGHGMSPPGFTSIIVSLFFFGGVQLFTLGLLGEYIWRIFEEVKGRPLYIIQQTSRKSQSADVTDSHITSDSPQA